MQGIVLIYCIYRMQFFQFTPWDKLRLFVAFCWLVERLGERFLKKLHITVAGCLSFYRRIVLPCFQPCCHSIQITLLIHLGGYNFAVD